MNKELFLKIVEEIGNYDLEDFEYEHEGKTYIFKCDDVEWDDQGKYQFAEEIGQLVEVDEKCKIIKRFDYGVSRDLTRSGSYFTGYETIYGECVPCEISEITIPEKVIPAHTEAKWTKIK